MLIASLFVSLAMANLPKPSARQLAWQDMEYYAFVHFGPNTFTENEWGSGKEDPALFNPASLDCRQWAKTFKLAGMKGVIITAKHHDGFCLWPSKFSSHTVAQSPWKDGRGDVLKELSEACRENGLKMGVYLSPWDRNHPTYGTPQYNQTFKSMLKEVLTQYGPIFEVWFDGANGEGPNGKRQVYDWPGFISTVRRYQPNAVIFSDAGPDIRWVGNESGFSATTCWSTLNRKEFSPGGPGYEKLTEGNPDGTDWLPPECDVSIRQGWFYKASEDATVKTGSQLFDLYLKSVGQNSSLLLNVPADKRGQIADADIEALRDFARIRQNAFDDNIAVHADFTGSKGQRLRGLADERRTSFQKESQITASWEGSRRVDTVLLREAIQNGQCVSRFQLSAKLDSGWKILGDWTTIGNKRIVQFPSVETNALRLDILDCKSTPCISEIGIYEVGKPQ